MYFVFIVNHKGYFLDIRDYAAYKLTIGLCTSYGTCIKIKSI